jgi:branched-chain amino acid transport system substrate-binding protein
MWEGALLAQEKINSEQICGAKLELLKFEDGGTPNSGTKTAYEIASNKSICAVIGHGYSDISMPCSLIYQYYGILTFNYISTIHDLTQRNNSLLFSNTPDDNDFAEKLASLCEKNDYKNVLIYYLENTSGISLSNSFELSCNNLGIEVVNRDSYDLTTLNKSIDRTVKKWKTNFNFDAVFIAGRMPIIKNIIQVIRENNLECPIIGADPFDDPLLAKELPESENGRIFAVSNYNSQSKNINFREFYDSFQKKFGTEPDQEAFQVYDALIVLAKAISYANSAEPEKIAHFLRKNLWYEAAGPYSFHENGAIKDRNLTIKVFNNGFFEEYDTN